MINIRSESQKRADEKYNQTENRKESLKRYKQTENGKEKQKESNARYAQTENGKEKRREAMIRYRLKLKMEEEKMFRLLDFVAKKETKKEEVDYVKENFVVNGNTIYIRDNDVKNLYRPWEIIFVKKIEENKYNYISIFFAGGTRISNIETVKENCTNDKNELLEFLKNKVDNKIEELKKIEEQITDLTEDFFIEE